MDSRRNRINKMIALKKYNSIIGSGSGLGS